MEEHNVDENAVDAQKEKSTNQISEEKSWSDYRDVDIMNQQAEIAEEAEKIPFVGDKASVVVVSLKHNLWTSAIVKE